MSPEETQRILEDMAQVLQHVLLDERMEAGLAFRDLKAKLHPPRAPRAQTHCPACDAVLEFHPADSRHHCPECGFYLLVPLRPESES